jgi:DNA-directed RNA polymerase subunit H (RpoH/RPB5)
MRIMPQTPSKMHILQSKHVKLNEKEAEKILEKLNVSKSQLPRIFLNDPSLPDGCAKGDIIKIERREGDKIYTYFRIAQ